MSTGFLLDTNIPSELKKPLPNSSLLGWLAAQQIATFHLSVISVGELRRGFSLLPTGKRRTQLEEWFERVILPLFGDRILPVTHAIGDRWGVLGAERQRNGKPLHLADGLIAATALEHGLTLVTRNTRDFAGMGLTMLNPWEDQS